MNNRLAEEIERKPSGTTPKMWSLGWLAWSGAFLLLLAVGLTVLGLPQQVGGRIDAADFNSQVISARAQLPGLSASEFQAPGQRGVVIWIEGADYIPAEAALR